MQPCCSCAMTRWACSRAERWLVPAAHPLSPGPVGRLGVEAVDCYLVHSPVATFRSIQVWSDSPSWLPPELAASLFALQARAPRSGRRSAGSNAMHLLSSAACPSHCRRWPPAWAPLWTAGWPARWASATTRKLRCGRRTGCWPSRHPAGRQPGAACSLSACWLRLRRLQGGGYRALTGSSWSNGAKGLPAVLQTLRALHSPRWPGRWSSRSATPCQPTAACWTPATSWASGEAAERCCMGAAGRHSVHPSGREGVGRLLHDCKPARPCRPAA